MHICSLLTHTYVGQFSHWSSCYGFKYDVEYPYLFNDCLITLLDLADDSSSRLLLISTMQLYAVVLLYFSFSLSLRDLQSEEYSSISSCLLPSPDESDPRPLALLLSNSFFAWLVNFFFSFFFFFLFYFLLCMENMELRKFLEIGTKSVCSPLVSSTLISYLLWKHKHLLARHKTTSINHSQPTPNS